MQKDNLGSRMKDNYENRSKTYLTRRQPIIIRLDGKAFHSFTKGLKRPFDKILMETMQETTLELCKNIQGCKLGYTQSDEISLLITDYDKLDTDAWFDYNVQKMVSISASMATLYFNNIFLNKVDELHNELMIEDFSDEKEVEYFNKLRSKTFKALFDSRVFNIPKEEVANCFIWRQQDATKNSITMVAQSYFSHKELQCKNGSQKQDMLMLEKGINWNDFSVAEKRGVAIKKFESWKIDYDTPIFSKNREYIEELI